MNFKGTASLPSVGRYEGVIARRAAHGRQDIDPVALVQCVAGRPSGVERIADRREARIEPSKDVQDRLFKPVVQI